MKHVLIIVLSLISTTTFGAKEFYSISRSIRALGMGNTYYALSNDESALFYNPAGLSLYSGNSEIMLPIKAQISTNAASDISAIMDAIQDNKDSASDMLGALQNFQGKYYNVGVGLFPYLLTNRFAVGLLLADTKANFGILGKDFETAIDLSAISDSGLFIGYGRPLFHPDLHLGITLKGIYRAGGAKNLGISEIAQGEDLFAEIEDLGGSGGGVDFDIGAIYELPELSAVPWLVSGRLGITFSNLLGSQMTLMKKGANPPSLSRTMSLGGTAFLKGIGPIDNFIVGIDFAEFRLGGEDDPHLGARVGSFWKHVNVGVEMPMKRFFALRLGLHQGLFGAGIGLTGKFAKLDLAWYGEELGQTLGKLSHHRFALQLALGAGDWYQPALKTTRSEARRQETEEYREKLRQVPENEQPATKTPDAPKEPVAPPVAPPTSTPEKKAPEADAGKSEGPSKEAPSKTE